MVRRLPTIAAVALVGALTACAGPNPATHFCEDYGKKVGKLYAAADDYAAAPAEFSAVADATMDDLTRLRAPDEVLGRALDSARFAFSVFSEDATLAEFLARADFAQDDVVKTCVDYGIELKRDEG